MIFILICMGACIIPTLIIGLLFALIFFILFFIFKLTFFLVKKASIWVCKKSRRVKRVISILMRKCIKIGLNSLFIKQISFFLFVGLINYILNRVVHTKLNDDALSSIVGVQATVFTIVIALLALISGNDNKYLGVEIKKFYFDYPCLPKQKWVLYIGALLVGINASLLYVRCFDLIFPIFVFSFYYILISIQRVCKIFLGSSKSFRKDVNRYISQMDKFNIDELIQYQEDLVSDWESKAASQSDAEYKIYEKTYIRTLLLITGKHKK